MGRVSTHFAIASAMTALAAALIPPGALAHVTQLPRLITASRAAPAAVLPSAPEDCPTSADDKGFASAERLLADNREMAKLGRRPTGSEAQLRFIGWLEQQLRGVRGLKVGAVPYSINRWVEDGAALEAGGATVPISGAVPYAKAADGRGPLV